MDRRSSGWFRRAFGQKRARKSDAELLHEMLISRDEKEPEWDEEARRAAYRSAVRLFDTETLRVLYPEFSKDDPMSERPQPSPMVVERHTRRRSRGIYLSFAAGAASIILVDAVIIALFGGPTRFFANLDRYEKDDLKVAAYLKDDKAYKDIAAAYEKAHKDAGTAAERALGDKRLTAKYGTAYESFWYSPIAKYRFSDFQIYYGFYRDVECEVDKDGPKISREIYSLQFADPSGTAIGLLTENQSGCPTTGSDNAEAQSWGVWGFERENELALVFGSSPKNEKPGVGAISLTKDASGYIGRAFLKDCKSKDKKVYECPYALTLEKLTLEEARARWPQLEKQCNPVDFGPTACS